MLKKGGISCILIVGFLYSYVFFTADLRRARAFMLLFIFN